MTGTFTITATGGVDVVIDVVGGYARPTDTYTYTYTYDSAGLRSAKTETGNTPVTFTWNTAGGLPLLLAETQGDEAQYVVYGPGGTPIYQITTTGDPIYYHQDHQGSTRLVTNHNGATRGTLTYNPHGKLTSNTTPWYLDQPLLSYTGQYTDTETGYLYLRARYYDPTTTQFTTQDPLVHATHEPYAYATNNPTNMADPRGLEPQPARLSAAEQAAIDAYNAGESYVEKDYNSGRRKQIRNEKYAGIRNKQKRSSDFSIVDIEYIILSARSVRYVDLPSAQHIAGLSAYGQSPAWPTHVPRPSSIFHPDIDPIIIPVAAGIGLCIAFVATLPETLFGGV